MGASQREVHAEDPPATPNPSPLGGGGGAGRALDMWSYRPEVLSTWVTAAEQAWFWEPSRNANSGGNGRPLRKGSGHRPFPSGTSGKVSP